MKRTAYRGVGVVTWVWFQGGSRVLALFFFLLLGLNGFADARFIRLRSGAITTPEPLPAGGRLQALAVESEVSGLFLVQFTNHVQPVWRAAMEGRGHQLIHFIPDDAFIVRLNGARLSELRALPYIRWIGEFRPQHKLDPRLVRILGANLRTNVPVKLLAVGDPGPAQMAGILRHLGGATRRQTFSLGTTFQGWVSPIQLRALAQSDAVLWIEPVTRMRMVDEVATKIVAGETDVPGSFARVHERGYDGRGVIVAVADSGLDSGDPTEMHPDVSGRVDALFAYDNLPDASDEHSHGTHVAGIVAGNGATGEKDENGQLYGLGVAPGAHLVAQRIFDGSGEYRPPPSYARLTQDAVRSGAYIGSNSWGDDTGGQYDLSAAEFDALVRDADPEMPGEQAYVLEFSAGNAGPSSQSIGSPAVAKNVIATGATQNNRYEFMIYGEGQEVMADFSSRGAAEDGRIKPDVVAAGTWIASLRSVFADDNNAWGGISDNYMYQGGTSQAGPHVSGAAAVVVQWYRDTHGGATPSPALVKALLINSADDMGTAFIPDPNGLDGGDGTLVGDTGPVPNNDEGWGRVNLVNLMDSDRRFETVEQAAGLATGQIFEKRVVVGDGDQLKVTMVYTDAPGLPAAIPALVNDLDLEVLAPDGTLYRGNAFAEGESAAGTPQGDRINNVEAVHMSVPQAGEWTVRVRGQNVVQDAHKRTNGVEEQDFALVISGQLPAPGEGVVSWNQASYRAPATASIRLVDTQLAGQSSVTVTVSSTTESSGFPMTLAPVGGNGNFLGTIEIVPGPAVAGDGRLSANDGDELAVVYQDANPPGERRATARIDLQPPLVSEVQTVIQFGRVTITWNTAESSSSLVYFGLTNAVTNLASMPGYVEQHRVALPELTAGETYYFYVVTADPAGNATTNLVDGRVYYRFVAPQSVSALLLYTPEALFAGGDLSDFPYPDITTWTAPLNALGLSYEVWDTSVVGRAPTTVELQNYQVVLWRPEELQGLVAGVVPAISDYVSSGGSLFVASFDLLSRLQETIGVGDFAAQVLHVASFAVDAGANSIQGVPGDPVGAGLSTGLNYNGFPSGLIVDLMGIVWPDGPDHLVAATNATPVFLQEDNAVVALRYPKTGADSQGGRVVFCAFALEAVPDDQPAPNNRTTLLANALRFLNPALVGGSTVAFDQSAYTVPGNVVVEATDSQRAGAGQLDITVANGAESQTLNLAETPRRGVFRGRFTLRATSAPVAAGQMTATNGDTLRATYVNAANVETSVEAMVDTVKPVISGISAEPSYNEAVVAWVTDKPADALVQFGESGGDASFLTRSAHNSESSVPHEVQLKGLLPDKTYYYQVVSRDAAGNMTIDNRAGQFYTLRTLKPMDPPWTDSFDQAEPGWAVYSDASLGLPSNFDDGEGGSVSGMDWQFGVPANARGVGAYTGTNVWATNLKGESVDYATTDLITPAISLVGQTKTTLRFWQYYDFSTDAGSQDDPFADIVIEFAQVALSTDNGATWKDLYAVNGTMSADWEQVEIDLSKYVGAVARIRFNYQLFGFSSAARMGWMIDDISVTTSSIASTEVQVRNNLAQAEFTLRGPEGLTILGAGQQFHTNVPPGEYSVNWQPVAYYLTPAPQTNQLATNAALVFQVVYTFPDANTNGISDLWEQHYFGEVASVHPAQTDADGDGASDWSEFLAGTDPKDFHSNLMLTGPLIQANRTVRFTWPSAPGREYQFEVSNDLSTWLPVGDPQRGTGQFLTQILPALDPRLPYFFRVSVTP